MFFFFENTINYCRESFYTKMLHKPIFFKTDRQIYTCLKWQWFVRACVCPQDCNMYHTNIKQVSNEYQANSYQILNKYQTNIEQISNGHQTKIKWISNEYQTSDVKPTLLECKCAYSTQIVWMDTTWTGEGPSIARAPARACAIQKAISSLLTHLPTNLITGRNGLKSTAWQS